MDGSSAGVRRSRAWSASVVMLTLVVSAGCQNAGQAGRPQDALATPAAAPEASPAALVERGKYLVDIGGCNDCHTPLKMGPTGPEPDMARFLSGHPADLAMPAPPSVPMPWMWVGSATNTAFAGPWGVSYAINLTPDDTGLGLWSEQVFVNAMKTGRHMGVGRPIMPPMPWPGYQHMTTEDLRAIFAYLRTVQPISNQAPDGVPVELPAGTEGN